MPASRRPRSNSVELALQLLQPPVARREAGAHHARGGVRELGGVAAAHRDAAGKAGERRPAADRRARAGSSPGRAPARRRRSRSCSRSIRLQNSSFAATTISAAADGVGARRSATKSAIVTSVSWPTAEMTGTGDSGDRARDDLLVERPEVFDRAAAAADDDDVDARHAPDRLAAPRAISSAAPSPCTRAGRMTRCAFAYRRRSTLMMSRIAAPSSEVTMPILRGSAGSGRLRACVEQPFVLQPLLQLIERELQRAQPVRLEMLADQLVLALRLVDRDAAARDDARGRRPA